MQLKTQLVPKPLHQLYQMIYTTAEAAAHLALEDFGAMHYSNKRLNDTTYLATLSVSFEELARLWQTQPPIFIHHICPPQIRIVLEQRDSDLDSLRAAVKNMLPPDQQPFSIQTRILDPQTKRPYQQFDLNQALSSELIAEGYTLNVQQPWWIFSLAVVRDAAYLGRSTAAQNLSDWAGGQRRFKRDDDQISRSEFKLLEAIEVFKLALPENAKALDLGAAPGGWTRLLRQWGYEVWAVDTAELAPALLTDPYIHHYREIAQHFVSHRLNFDFIANDMRLDIAESARLVNALAFRLKPSGLVIMTMKLPPRGVRQAIEEGLTTLRRNYEVLGVRQLFHNRHEVTVALRKLTVAREDMN